MKKTFNQTVGRILLTLLPTATLVSGPVQATPLYDVTILRSPYFGKQIDSFSINDQRQITGDLHTDAVGFHAFTTPPITQPFDADAYASDPTHSPTNLYYRNLTDLGTFGGQISRGRDINNHGQVAGTARDASGASWAFVSDPTSHALNRLPSLNIDTSNPPKNYNTASGINESGTVAGYGTTGATDSRGRLITHAYVGDTTGVTDIGTLGGQMSYGMDINDHGQVTGISSRGIVDVGGTPVDLEHGDRAFVWDAVNGMTDLGALSSGQTMASRGYGINNRGQVTGASALRFYDARGRRNDVNHAFLWDAINGMTDLGTLYHDPSIRGSSVGWDINDLGQVVGYSDGPRGGLTAFLWENGVMYDLNDLINPNQPTLGFIGGRTQIGINNYGDIAIGNYLLVRRNNNAVPEPSLIALLVPGLIGLGIMRKRRG